MGNWSIVGPTGTEVVLREVNVLVRSVPGSGVPPLHQVALEDALVGGVRWQRAVAEGRVLTLRLVPRVRQAVLPAVRAALVAVLNPDLVNPSTPAYLRYAGASRTVQVPVVYQGGLEGSAGYDVQQEPPTPLELALLAPDPVWVATTVVDAVSLEVATPFSGGRVVARSAAGEWSVLGNLTSGAVHTLAFDAEGVLYAGGTFSNGALSFFARWTGTDWAAEGGSGAVPDWDTYTLAVGPDGSLYAGLGGAPPVVRKRTATAWAGLPGVDAALGTTSSDVRALAFGSDGKLYLGGRFVGGAITTHVAAFDPAGSAWSSLDGGVSGGGTTRVYALARGPDGRLYAGGSFTTPGHYVAVWNPRTSAWSPLGSDDLDGIVEALQFMPDGRLVAAGAFTGRIAVWNGVVWLPLGTLDATVGKEGLCLAVRSDGLLYAGGTFDTADGLTLPDHMAQWNGYAWFPLDVTLPSSSAAHVTALLTGSDGAVYVGYNQGGSGTCAGITEVINAGSAAAYPAFTITGPGRLHEVVNWTTGEALFFDLVLLEGETLTIDLAPGGKSAVSSFRGNVVNALLPGSQFTAWRLTPGVNQLAVYMTGTSVCSGAAVQWSERFWSLDGV
ncbi:MAG: hypothetical protein HC884_01480 [Chloroflexaceae bacterium]|nr:hypothetical protein [Chloroflexaceae bacterium]